MQIDEMLKIATEKIDLATQKEAFLEIQIQNWLNGTSQFRIEELQALIDSTREQMGQLQGDVDILINQSQFKCDQAGMQVEKMGNKDAQTIQNIRFNLEFMNARIELLRIHNNLLKHGGVEYLQSSFDNVENEEQLSSEDKFKKMIAGIVAAKKISLGEAKILYQNISVSKENAFDAMQR